MSVTLSKSIAAKPFVKWAGGKSQLISEIRGALVKVLLTDQSFTYVEPFVGGGAVLFHVVNTFPNVEKVVINDINTDLITAYKVIIEESEDLLVGLSEIEEDYYQLQDFEEKKAFFLDKRQEFNQIRGNAITCAIAKTVLFIFLNKTCFNGLYRVNNKGLFNVPFGGYLKPKICDRANLLAIRDRLLHIDIYCGDFTQMISYLDKNTLFYLDPPYKPLSLTSSFTSYTKEDFTDHDQIRVKEFCDRVHLGGGKFMLSNSDVQNSDRDPNFFDELYRDYSIRIVKAKRSINCKGQRRGLISELLIVNF